jgi:hypothetical protein
VLSHGASRAYSRFLLHCGIRIPRVSIGQSARVLGAIRADVSQRIRAMPTPGKKLFLRTALHPKIAPRSTISAERVAELNRRTAEYEARPSKPEKKG